jgi:hypothetical protein
LKLGKHCTSIHTISSGYKSLYFDLWKNQSLSLKGEISINYYGMLKIGTRRESVNLIDIDDGLLNVFSGNVLASRNKTKNF